jgi:transposase, IS30 family
MEKYTHLEVTDRRRLYVFIEMGLSVSEIAKRLGKHRSTIYRELARNTEPAGYFPVLAQEKTEERAKQKRSSKIQTDGVLRDYIIRSLEKGWSPEQISGRMKYKKVSFYACHETIYQYIYRSKNKTLYTYLAYKKPKRRRRYARKKQRCRYGNIRLITQRPNDIASRKRFGHWEGDTIEFRGTKEKVITTLVERKSRMVYLIKNERKYSRGVMDKIGEKLKTLPEKMCKTITFDQGIEFADYRHLEQKIPCKTYYCETHSPWQKGSNENMNGRLRWSLPRETEISKITQEELDQLAAKMNRCPRKCLGFKTPNELFIQQYKNDCRIWS